MHGNAPRGKRIRPPRIRRDRRPVEGWTAYPRRTTSVKGKITMNRRTIRGVLACAAASLSLTALASSHREAPFIAGQPKVDGTDFYLFRSYEPGRSDYVTFIANYNPLQDAYGGPNYFTLDPKALYEIRIDNNGDSKADLSFQFRFSNTYKNLTVNAGGQNVAVP